MEGGIDVVDEGTAQDVAPEILPNAPIGQEREEEDNKFHKAIGAWRSAPTTTSV